MTTPTGTGSSDRLGFAGLSLLTTDVDGFIAETTQCASQQRVVRQPIVSNASEPTRRDISWNGIVGMTGLLTLMVVLTIVASSNPSPTRDDPPPSVPVEEPVDPEQKPPVGPGQVFSTGQIRYCLSEDIRLEAARHIEMTNASVKHFNALIEDYNRRCSDYRYGKAAYESMQRLVARNRVVLEAEGKARFQHGKASHSPSPAPPVEEPVDSEQKPPVGSSQVFSTGQIRYCLSEDIRLEGARHIEMTEASVKHFNALIEDYNRRCVGYRYGKAAYESMQRLVARNRVVLEAEGKARFQYGEAR